ncbi:methylmalonyl-CoA epimerase [Mucilaginibacter sp. KACC 22773]|uniref:methylmalonyl-CoA epimerase n=1 Tax=Mucilaginibacter sp. KACC 22773 TaxID=3025671 RepID=UPI0023650B42|nr:methylmalonyl-CoA epimerase [Mucilaginibacter sp. KACC 22773]WDF80366.1 methylmalonyl-CoA epimerase [Mucilaginibacter sp. KACC 22773]
MNKVEHIGIAVTDISVAGNIYEKLLNTPVYKTETVTSEGVLTAFLQTGPNKVELLQALNDDSPIAKFIAKKGEGIHHIAFEVDDIVAEMHRLKKEGFVLLNDEPKQGADNKLVCFVHPKSANGVLIELCQAYDYPEKAKRPELSLEDEICLFQFRNKLIIPGDLLAYLKLTDEEIDSYNRDMFVFYKFSEFKSVKDEVGNYGGTPDYRQIVNILPEHENCFVFAEYSIHLMVFAIRLYGYGSDKNEVYAICGSSYEIVANSFEEFIARYKDDISNVLI